MLEDYEAKPDLLATFTWEKAPPCVGFADLAPADPLAERVWMLGWPEPFPEAEVVKDNPNWPPIQRLRARHTYDPMDVDHAALFLDFMELADEQGPAFERACKEFASQYGMLGLWEPLPLAQAWPRLGLCYRLGERLSVWRAAADLFHLAVRLWLADQQGQPQKKQSLTWATEWLRGRAKDGPERMPGHVVIHPALGATTPLVRVPGRDEGRPYTPVHRRALLANLTNAFLSQGLTHAVTQDQKGRYSLQVIPDSLWRLMWYQLAQAQGAIPGFLRCHTCGRWRVRHHHVARGNRRYCDQSCKQLAYERRRKRAVQVHAENPALTAEMIVEVLAEEEGYRATKPATVSKWLASSIT